MSRRQPADPAPGPLEEYVARFDELFATLAQRQAFRRYLEGLLLPTERNKTLTALANTEPVLGAQRKERHRVFSGSSPSRAGLLRRSTSAGWRLCSKIRGLLLMQAACW
jgi:SRSO17 transposase